MLLWSRALLGATAEPLLRALSLLDGSREPRRRLRHLVRSATGSAPARVGRGRPGPLPLLRPRHAIVLRALRQLAVLRVDPSPGPGRHRSGQHARSDRPAAPGSHLLRRSGRLGRRQRRPSAAWRSLGSGADQGWNLVTRAYAAAGTTWSEKRLSARIASKSPASVVTSVAPIVRAVRAMRTERSLCLGRELGRLHPN